jgi:hypothetical protein
MELTAGSVEFGEHAAGPAGPAVPAVPGSAR